MIKLQDAHKTFDHRGIAGLHGLSFEVEKNKVVAIIGPNGSGKTTLLNVLTKKVSLDQGKLETKGRIHLLKIPNDVPEMNVQKYLISLVTLAIDEEKKVQLSRDLADMFEFTFQLRQNLHELSSGQRQKILLAGELINNPEILLMDEPFTHLDPYTRKDILEQLFHYLRLKKITTLWVTHELNEATKFSDSVMLLQFGKLEQWGSPEELTFSPRSLFAAKFMGHRNFVVVSRMNDAWSTPWGPMVQNFSITRTEALLLIPSTEWIIDESSGQKMTIERVYPEALKWTHVLKFQDQVFEFSSQDFLGKPGTQLNLRPNFLKSSLIPL